MSTRLSALDDAAWASPWRSLPCLDKAALALTLVVTALVAPVWPGTILVAAVALGLLLGAARIPARVVLVAVTPPAGFAIVGGLSVGVVVGPAPRDAVASWGPVAVTPASLSAGAGLVAHAVAGTLAILVLAATTPMVDLVTALRRLRIPEACLDIASLIYRLVFVLVETAFDVRDAHRGRLGDVRRGTRGAAVGIVLLRTYDRVRRLDEGLAARGIESTALALPPVCRRDARMVLLGVAAVGFVWAAVALA